MSLVGQLHSSRPSNFPVMRWIFGLLGEFHGFPWPQLSPAAQCRVRSIVIPSLAIYKIDEYHRKIQESLLKPRAG